MQVLHIEAGRHLYGGARQVGYLVASLAARGVENLLVCRPGHPLTGLAPVATILPTALHGDLDFALTSRLARLIRAHSPDVVHVHSRRGADSAGGRGYCALAPLAGRGRRDISTHADWVRGTPHPLSA